MNHKNFEDLWWQIQHRLRSRPAPGASAGVEIRNWTVLKGYLGDTMRVVAVHAESIEVDSPRARNIIVVPKAHFKAVWEVWPLYTNLQMQRQELTPITFFSKYIISILHWLEAEES
jgi:hypothetical protein